MSRIVTVLCAVLLALTSVARADDNLQALIWGGGATDADAQAALKTFQERRVHWHDAIRLADGFPKVVESKDVAGLKPGFHIVIVGFCAEAAMDALGWVRGLDPGAYARKVTGSSPACPVLAPSWNASLSTLRSKGSELSGLELWMKRDDHAALSGGAGSLVSRVRPAHQGRRRGGSDRVAGRSRRTRRLQLV